MKDEDITALLIEGIEIDTPQICKVITQHEQGIITSEELIFKVAEVVLDGGGNVRLVAAAFDDYQAAWTSRTGR